MAPAETSPSDWIQVRVAKALEHAPVNTEVADLLRESMLARMADRRLPAGELSKLAKELLAKLDPAEQ